MPPERNRAWRSPACTHRDPAELRKNHRAVFRVITNAGSIQARSFPLRLEQRGEKRAVLTLMDFTTVRIDVAVPDTEAPFVKKITGQSTVDELPVETFQGADTRFSYALD